MKIFKHILLAVALSFTMLSANNDKVLQAIEVLQAVEAGEFEHQTECTFSETEYCTCDGNYLSLIEYNRILQATQLLYESIEETSGDLNEES